MLSVSVELLHGTFRGDPDGSANTGQLTRGEWPPSPARLFAAFVAADGTGQACRVTDGTELEWFVRLPPPVIHADPAPVHQPLRPRYVVQHGARAAKGSHQEYVGRSGGLSRAGVRVVPRSPCVVYQWDVAPPQDTILDALCRRAARVGYLGSADSAVRARVTAGMLPPPLAASAFVPDHRGSTSINVTRPGDLDLWDRLHKAWIERGPSVTRSQFPALTHPTTYRSPLSDGAQARGEVVAWLRLTPAVSGRRISTLTALFKQAVLSQHQRLHGTPPAVLHGHGLSGTGYEIARYLALPDVGYPRSRGRVHGLALWLPPGCDVMARRTARDAAVAIRRLAGRGLRRGGRAAR